MYVCVYIYIIFQINTAVSSKRITFFRIFKMYFFVNNYENL